MNFPVELSYRQLPEVFYTETALNPIQDPTLFLYNKRLSESLGLKEMIPVSILAGNDTFGLSPIAQAYAGHQFGHFAMLGDGRALLLGELMVGQKRYDIQLKGSGRTMYSRMGDGRAPLGPMIREYIISEAMAALNIPTTRSLAIVETNETVVRNQYEQGAVLTRIAQSHIRVGTFEYAAFMTDDIQALADYAIDRHYPESRLAKNPYLALLNSVIKAQASLIAAWQSIGFIHGVMNTDNMSIAGETIDYGPCAFMDEFHHDTVFSSIDTNGRYRYGNQPSIGKWNLARFAESLITLLDDDQEKAVQLATQALDTYDTLYKNYYLDHMAQKIGISKRQEHDDVLIIELLNLMERYEQDYTNTFVDLMNHQLTDVFNDWHVKWKERIEKEHEPYQLMHQTNPIVIPRNHLVEEVIHAAEQDNKEPLLKLLDVITDPYNINHNEKYRSLPKDDERVRQTFCGT